MCKNNTHGESCVVISLAFFESSENIASEFKSAGHLFSGVSMLWANNNVLYEPISSLARPDCFSQPFDEEEEEDEG